MRAVWKSVIIGVLLTVAGTVAQGQPPRFVREVAWHDRGVWLKADTHVHTVFSDGSATVTEVVDKAATFGCNVIAITDHSDHNLKGQTDAYFAAIDAARAAHPAMVIFAGLEWNIPPWGGDEHAVVLVLPSAERKLAGFKERFDDLDTGPGFALSATSHKPELAAAGLRWLAENATVEGIPPVVMYEHPSRKDDHSIENVADVKFWRTVNDLVVGFSGAPGHQRAKPLGSYKYKEVTIDRWDPAAARIGDAWDTLLGQGLDVWAASAPSDFHNVDPADLNDYWPGQFSETWMYAPSRTAQGVLQALRAGSFFADHGAIVREVELRVRVAGLARAAGAGEVIAAAPATNVSVELSFRIPERALPEGTNRIDQVELIAIKNGTASVVATATPSGTGPALTYSTTVPAGGVVFRSRGSRRLPDGDRLMFYTNPVRIVAKQ